MEGTDHLTIFPFCRNWWAIFEFVRGKNGEYSSLNHSGFWGRRVGLCVDSVIPVDQHVSVRI